MFEVKNVIGIYRGDWRGRGNNDRIDSSDKFPGATILLHFTPFSPSIVEVVFCKQIKIDWFNITAKPIDATQQQKLSVLQNFSKILFI